jgi:hypothetical protein
MAGVATSLHNLSPQDVKRMQEAGLQWLRSEIHGLNHEMAIKGEKQGEAFYEARDKLTGLRAMGLRIMGITPGPANMPASAGQPGSPEYFENYRKMCRFLGEAFRGIIDYWQAANELDIWIFRDTLTLEQSAAFLKAGLQGLRHAGKDLKIGINITLFPDKPGEVDGNTDAHEGTFIAESICRDPELDLDYIGFDSYPGSWREGGAESWHEYLDALHDLTGKPIIIQEFGYSSGGDVMTADEAASGVYPCKIGKWRFSWHGAHTPEVQADFITESYKIFAEKPYVIGAFYYRWQDQEICWQCKSAGCPIETAWGLVDRQNNLKPAYHSLKASLTCFASR